MKQYHKSMGWLVKCVGGELDGTHVRTWCLQDGPEAEAEAIPERMRIITFYGEAEYAVDTRGAYVLRLTGKTAKASGTLVPSREYVWEPS